LTQLVPTGMAFTMNQNQVYALPMRVCTFSATIPIQSSQDGTNWSGASSGGTFISGGGWVRCTTGSPVAVFKPQFGGRR